MTRSAPPDPDTSRARRVKEDPRLPIIDFHCHGGDASRTSEIGSYAASEGLEALVLLSLPLHGYPGYSGSRATMNDDVLESARKLGESATGETGASRKEGAPGRHAAPRPRPEVFAFGCLDHSSGRTAAEQVAALDEAGFRGLKLLEGKPGPAAALNLMPDSPLLLEACREAGRRGMPVIFHVADPPDFWRHGRENGTSGIYPAGYKTPPIAVPDEGNRQIPGFESLIEAAGRLCIACPDTDIIFPHLLFLAGSLERAAGFLDAAPRVRFDLAPGNYMYAELASRQAESRNFFSEYRYRILFGSDGFFFQEAAGDGGRDGESGSDRDNKSARGMPAGGMRPGRLLPDGLPFGGDSLEGNRTRCRRLRKFLEGGPSEVIQNPYPGSRDAMPEVACLDLETDILEPVLAGNARRLLEGQA